MRRAIGRGVLVCVSSALVLAAAWADDSGPRQYYSPWRQNPLDGTWFRYYYFRSAPDGSYNRQVCLYAPQGPAGVLYFDPDKKQFWGRLTRQGQSPMFSTIPAERRTSRLADLRDADFAPAVQLSQALVPGATDGASIVAPPDETPSTDAPAGADAVSATLEKDQATAERLRAEAMAAKIRQLEAELVRAQSEARAARTQDDPVARTRDQRTIAALQAELTAAQQRAAEARRTADAAELARQAAAQRAATAEDEMRKVRETMNSFKGVVTLRNPTSAGGDKINYSMRWQRYDGVWSNWEQFNVPNDYSKWHSFVGAVQCHVEFDHVAGDDAYTGKEYYLNFNRVPADKDVTIEDGRKYKFQYNERGDRIDLYFD